MKKLIAGAAILAALAGTAVASHAQPTGSSVLILGSSTTACVGPSEPSKCYVNLLKAERPGDTFAVWGRGGTTLALGTPDTNWTQTTIPGGHDVVVLQLGVNDWRNNLAHATFRTHVDEFLTRVRAANPNARIFWLMTWIPQHWPPTPDTWGKLWQDHGVQVATALRAVNGELIDMGPSGTRRESAPFIVADNLHINDRGHRLMADAVKARIWGQ